MSEILEKVNTLQANVHNTEIKRTKSSMQEVSAFHYNIKAELHKHQLIIYNQV